jgi:probable addiction module antidote protein
MKSKHDKPYVEYQVVMDQYLSDPEEAIAYLNVCLQATDAPEIFLSTLSDVVRIHGMAMVADKSKLNRENLYRMLSKKGNPRFSSLMAVLDALGFCLSISPKPLK